MKTLAKALAALLLLTLPATADPLPSPKGPAVLTVSGHVESPNSGAVAALDLDTIEGLGMRTSVNRTPWYKKTVKFEGPLASAVLDAVGAKGTKLRIVALNDYSVEVPLEDFRKWPVLLATRIDGKRMTVREKGPLFLIYPFDSAPELYTETYFGRSIWQIKSIEVI